MKYFATIIVIILPVLLFGQTCTITGEITGKSNSELLSFVNVILLKNNEVVMGCQSDFDGNYLLKDVPYGEYTIRATSVGFTSFELRNFVVDETTQVLNIEMGQDVTIRGCCFCYVLVREEPLLDTVNLFAEQKILDDSINALLPSTGFSETVFTDEFMAYPNPTEGLITLSNLPETSEMLLMDITGKIIKRIFLQADREMVIDLASYQRGMYLLRYEVNGEVEVKKLIRK